MSGVRYNNMSSHSKIPPRIQSAPPDEGEPYLKAPYNVKAAEFKPDFLPSNSRVNTFNSTQKKELRADAVSYEPTPVIRQNPVSSFSQKKELSVNSPAFELSSSAFTFIPDAKLPSDIAKIPEFHFEPVVNNEVDSKKLDKNTQETIETFPASEKLPDTIKDHQKAEESQKPLEKQVQKPPEPEKNLENIERTPEETSSTLEKSDEEGKVLIEMNLKTKRVYDYEIIKKLKSDFLKNPKFLFLSNQLTMIKDREVEILKKSKGGKRQEERKGFRETIGKVTWRKARTAEEQKISEKAKEYQRKFSSTLDEQKLISKQIRITLNKLSPNNLEKLTLSILETCKKSHDCLKLVVSGIFEKAWAEKKYTQMYSDICKNLKIHFEGYRYPDTDEFKLPETKNYFKYELLFMCEQTFISNPEDTETVGLTEEQKAEKINKMKGKILGNVRFIGELFNVNLITGKIVLECVDSLINMFETENNEDKLEGACLLLLTGGASFERAKLKDNTDVVYQRLQTAMKRNLSARIRFKVLDLIEFRVGGWKAVKKEEVKTIEKIHEEFRVEQNEILRRHGLNS